MATFILKYQVQGCIGGTDKSYLGQIWLSRQSGIRMETYIWGIIACSGFLVAVCLCRFCGDCDGEEGEDGDGDGGGDGGGD